MWTRRQVTSQARRQVASMSGAQQRRLRRQRALGHPAVAGAARALSVARKAAWRTALYIKARGTRRNRRQGECARIVRGTVRLLNPAPQVHEEAPGMLNAGGP